MCKYYWRCTITCICSDRCTVFPRVEYGCQQTKLYIYIFFFFSKTFIAFNFIVLYKSCNIRSLMLKIFQKCPQFSEFHVASVRVYTRMPRGIFAKFPCFTKCLIFLYAWNTNISRCFRRNYDIFEVKFHAKISQYCHGHVPQLKKIWQTKKDLY